MKTARNEFSRMAVAAVFVIGGVSVARTVAADPVASAGTATGGRVRVVAPAAGATNPWRTRTRDLVERAATNPDDGVFADLRGVTEQRMTATIDADGHVTTRCEAHVPHIDGED